MRHDDPNLPSLRLIAEALGELRDEVVFVGGAVAGLLITDPLAEGVRATRDVDAVVDAGRAQFHQVEARVAAAGFIPDMDAGVICRWIHRASGVLFDIMPIETDVLGFSNAWYRYAAESAVLVDLGDGHAIRAANSVAFVATKLEAFRNRGQSDVLSSHDLEDVLNIVDGREALVAELADAPPDVQAFIRSTLGEILGSDDFANALPGLISEPERAYLVLDRLQALAR